MPDTATADPFGAVVFAYTRRQAIEDDVLVDVTDTAREAGFRIPVALSRAAWERLVALPEGYRGFQDEAGGSGTSYGWRVTTRSAPPTATASRCACWSATSARTCATATARRAGTFRSSPSAPATRERPSSP